MANDVAQPAGVMPLRSIVGIPDDLVSKVPEMEHKAESIAVRLLLVFPDHAAVGGGRALLHILTTHEGEVHSSPISHSGSSNRPPDPAAKAMLVGKAIPVLCSRFEVGDKKTAGPSSIGFERELPAPEHLLATLGLGV